MASVGQKCFGCANAVESPDDGYFCAPCESAWHARCLPVRDADTDTDADDQEGPRCPDCGVSFARSAAAAEAARTADEASARATAPDIAHGRRLFMLGAGQLLLALLLGAVMQYDARGEFWGVLRLLAAGALLYAVYRGAVWARVLSIALLFALTFLALLGAAASANLAQSLVLLGVAGIATGFGAALSFSRAVRSFLSAQAGRAPVD